MLNLQKDPLKLYVQDIFRAKRTKENKYVYELFGLTFKNIKIHGCVTSVYNKTGHSTNLELSDPTGSVQIYYDSRKNNLNISTETMKDLFSSYTEISRCGDENIHTMTTLMNALADKKQNPMPFEEGSYLSIVGDIFVDDVRNIRMVSAYEFKLTTMDYQLIWLEELKYLYEKFYLWEKKPI